jgi:hypothetical protein
MDLTKDVLCPSDAAVPGTLQESHLNNDRPK